MVEIGRADLSKMCAAAIHTNYFCPLCPHESHQCCPSPLQQADNNNHLKSCIPFNFPWYQQHSLSAVGLGEFIGTFFLVYIVALCVTLAPIDAVTPLAIGGAIFCLCNIFGDLTGAHFNPCITIPVYLCDRRFSFARCCVYVASQTCGAILAVQVGAWTANGLRNPFSWAAHAADNFSVVQIILAELLFTCLLSLTALRAGFLQTEPNALCPVWVAGAVVAASFAGGPVSGTCINPALIVGWVVADGSVWDLLPYLVGPISGCVLASAIVMVVDPDIYHRRMGLSVPPYLELKRQAAAGARKTRR